MRNEKREVTQLNTEQNERAQQLLNVVEESDGDEDDENERTRQSVSFHLAKNPAGAQGSLARGSVPQLQAELDYMRSQWEVDR